MNARSAALWTALLIALLVLGYMWVNKNIEWVEEEVDGPMSLQARKHDLLAASRYLDELGYQSEMIHSGDFFSYYTPHTDTILLQTLPSTLTDSAYDRLLNWVDNGGHLIFGLDGSGLDEAPAAWLESLGVTPTQQFESPQNSTDSFTLTIDGIALDEPLTVSIDPSVLFTLWAGTPVSINGRIQELFAFAQMEHGAGHVSVFADQYLWGNDHIGNNDNARLLAAVIAQRATIGSTVYISDTSTSLPGVFTMLWQRLRWFCVLMIVLGVALLRRSWVRFGPVQTLPETRSNNFARHLLAVAQFQGRYQSVDRLLGPARQRVLSRYASTATPVAAVSANDETETTGQAELIFRAQQASQLPAGQIEKALFKSANKATILQVATTLQALDRVVEK